MTFVLIGSKALELLFSKGSENLACRDIDIITDSVGGSHLCLQADEKKGRILKFSGCTSHKTASDNNVVDLKLDIDNKVTSQIYKDALASKTPEWLTGSIQLSPNTTINVIIPPAAYLHALYKSHLHRIPKIFSGQHSNIEVWLRWLDHYLLIRNKNDYELLDDMIEKDTMINRIFNIQFDYVTEILGDTFSMDKAEEEFFDDNVDRVIPHDDIHKAVAHINRKTNEPLFPKFLKEKDSVQMDKDLFLAASRNEQINTIMEEIMVLWLERIMLPFVIEEGTNTFLSADTLNHNDLRDLMVHFVTNLCDNGHSWLRQWAIDHWNLYSYIDDYPMEELIAFANKFNPDCRLYGSLQPNTSANAKMDREGLLQYHKELSSSSSYKSNLAEIQKYLEQCVSYDRYGRHGNIIYETFQYPSEKRNPNIETSLNGYLLIANDREEELHSWSGKRTGNYIDLGAKVKRLNLRINNDDSFSLLTPSDLTKTEAKEVESETPKADRYIFFHDEDMYDSSFFIIYDIVTGIGIYTKEEDECEIFLSGFSTKKDTKTPEEWLFHSTTASQINQTNKTDKDESTDEDEEKETDKDESTDEDKETDEEQSFDDPVTLESVCNNLFIMEIKKSEDYNDQKVKFALHFINNDTTACTYFLDTRQSTYYISTCSGGANTVRDRTYMNHYGNVDDRFKPFLETLSRILLDLKKDEQSDDD